MNAFSYHRLSIHAVLVIVIAILSPTPAASFIVTSQVTIIGTIEVAFRVWRTVEAQRHY